MNTKWLWIGQRFSDGLLYSRALNELDIFFSCDDLIGDLPSSFKLYSLSTKEIPSKWTSNHIQFIITKHCSEINKYISDGYGIFPYFISDDAKKKLRNTNALFNKHVFRNQLSRGIQMQLMASGGVNTPRWIVPKASSWSDLTSVLGSPFILQFDNTSSGSGTYCIKSESAYYEFSKCYGEADIATEYIDKGLSCSSHIFITPKNVIVSSASVQIIENNTFDHEPDINTFSFRGNDFGLYASSIGTNSKVIKALLTIGEVYQKAGIFGLLGVDFIMKENVFFYNETNFRLQNSTSLLSFLQPIGSGNVVQCLTSEPREFSEIACGYQYFLKAPVPNLTSGYFSTAGHRLGDVFSKDYYKQNDAVLILASNYTSKEQSLRIIGFNKCLDIDGRVDSLILNLIEKLVRLYGHI